MVAKWWWLIVGLEPLCLGLRKIKIANLSELPADWISHLDQFSLVSLVKGLRPEPHGSQENLLRHHSISDSRSSSSDSSVIAGIALHVTNI